MNDAAEREEYLRAYSEGVGLSGMNGGHPALDRALESARRSETLLRRLIADAVRTYGADAVRHEFLLRRMTHLSLSLFWLVSSVTALRKRFPDGDYPADEISLLDYLAEEAREVQQRDGHFQPDGLELAHAAVMKHITA